MSSRAFAFAILSRVMRFDRETNKILATADNGIELETGNINVVDGNVAVANGDIQVANGGIQVDASIESANRKVASTSIIGTSIGTVDSFLKESYRSARYLISATNGTDYHTIHILLQHDGTNVQIVQFASIYDLSELANYSADIDGTLVRLRGTPTKAGTTLFKYNVELISS